MNLKFSEKETVNILYALNFLVCLIALLINKIELKYLIVMFTTLIVSRK